MTLRGPQITRWSPTAGDPLNGCNNKTRYLYALVKEQPGIAQRDAAARLGRTYVQSSITTLIGRDLIEVRQDARFNNYLWLVPR